MSSLQAPVSVSIVPRRLRQALALLAVIVVVVMGLVALSLPSTTNTVVEYGLLDQIAIAGLGLVLAGGVLFFGRSRVDADADGVRIRNILVHHELRWTAVRAVRFDRKSYWGSLLLENGDEVSLLALQSFDGETSVRGVEALRVLHAAARAKDPVRPPLLYDD
ncbi:PH domain-containing protein [Blastococcus sp. LR1]|uniref:PH domain-containing protein n=1 Tax=Blastococcus sp. LR1 TaxID=2877000 RepID=UPI001CCA6FDC|nr:PH domain-containing protein [Blastococcus sp. LR1]MCA0143363.1 PH domain-containing protein [Blastococcus sp. LR1]